MEPVAAGPSWVPPARYPRTGWWTRRRRRIALFVGIPLGSLIVLLVAAWLALPYFVRAYVLQRLEARFGVTLEAADIDAGFGYVRFEDVRVRSRETGLPLGHVGSIEADVDLWAVLRGRIGLRRLELFRPEVDVRLRGDDDWSEVVRIARRAWRGGRRLAGGGGSSRRPSSCMTCRYASRSATTWASRRRSPPAVRRRQRLELTAGEISVQAGGVSSPAPIRRATAALRGDEVRLEGPRQGRGRALGRTPGLPTTDVPPARACRDVA